MSRVCIIGLDCLAPELVFGRYRGALPTFDALAACGAWGPLESCVPPITIPAWACMTTGADPGMLGCYGFHDRADHGYGTRRLASSLAFRRPPLWSILGRAGLDSRIIGVPGTYPVKPMRGALVSCFLTPSPRSPFTHPPELADEVQEVSGGYVFDTPDFRVDEPSKPALLADLHVMTERRFRLAESWLRRDDWRLFMMVEMGPDRLHHAFWRYQAPDHPDWTPGHPLEHAIRDYYRELDGRLGRLVELLSPDDLLLVVSDHGARTMRGGFAINEWLVERGYLKLHDRPRQRTRFDAQLVDWSRTRAWADGGYVGRVHLNVRGREPRGVVAPEDVDALTREIAEELRGLRGPEGEPMHTRVHDPRRIYRELNGVAPALIVEVEGLARRALASLGYPTLFPAANDEGPDDANHDRFGVFLMRDGRGGRAKHEAVSIYDIAPTVLARLGLERPSWMHGRALVP